MKLQPVLASVIVSSTIVAACCAAPTVTAAWHPNKADLGKLAPAVTKGKYQIQPPKYYILYPQPASYGASADIWLGPTYSDGTRPYVMLIAIVPPAGEQNKYTLSQFTAKILRGLERQRGSWKQSPTEEGSISGLTFLRTYWQGTDLTTKQPMSGFSYVAKDNTRFIVLLSQAVVSYHKADLSLAEASALTFKDR